MKRSYSPNYGQRRRPHAGPEVYLVGLERRDDVLHALLWGPGHGEFAMPVGDEQPRGRVCEPTLCAGSMSTSRSTAAAACT